MHSDFIAFVRCRPEELPAEPPGDLRYCSDWRRPAPPQGERMLPMADLPFVCLSSAPKGSPYGYTMHVLRCRDDELAPCRRRLSCWQAHRMRRLAERRSASSGRRPSTAISMRRACEGNCACELDHSTADIVHQPCVALKSSIHCRVEGPARWMPRHPSFSSRSRSLSHSWSTPAHTGAATR